MPGYENEAIVVQRDVMAVAIPAGAEVKLKLGAVGYITQALGGNAHLRREAHRSA